jgi:2-oxo-3-hexenedioate decarboxylase
MTTDATILRNIASEAFAALNLGGQQIPSFSARYPSFTLDDAYRATALAHGMRISQGYKPLGRKAGFTNRQMWKEYGVGAPNWGYVYDRTIHDLGVPLPVAPYSEPKIEPEIMFGLAAPPTPGMDDAALLSCIAWVAHGFEIVQSIFPNWKFSLPDCTAANAMHGALLIGPRHEVGAHAAAWLRTLPQFEVELYCDGKLMDRGRGSNVLDGPLSAVRHLIELLARDPDNAPLAAGEIVSTGTLTRALPVKPGETWTTTLKGVDLEGVSLRFT